jgi:hypothetical protein
MRRNERRAPVCDLSCMWPYYPELLSVPVPRYTSYPTAVEFSDRVGLAEQEAALAQVSGDISLYIHIPFCEQICWYCGCNTAAANKRSRLEAAASPLAAVARTPCNRPTSSGSPMR